MAGAEFEYELLIVGAGPVGLTAALAARRLGLSVAVLEATSENEPGPGSRALFVNGSSLRLLDQLRPGLGAAIGAAGLVWRRRLTTWRGRTVYARHFPPAQHGVLPPFTSLRQADTQAMLRSAVKQACVPIYFEARVQALLTTTNEVRAVTTDGLRRCAYLLGADGGSSTIRAAVGIPLDGRRSDAYHVVVDVADPTVDDESARVFHYQFPALDQRNVLIVPFRGGCQVDVQCLRGELPQSLVQSVDQWLAFVLGSLKERQIMSVSHYPFHQRVAAGFLAGEDRVLLAGDAAHLFAPFGARGMNSGLQDASDAITAIARALAVGPGSNRLDPLRQYDTVRRATARANRRATQRALRHLQPRTPIGTALQASAAAVSAKFEPAGRWLEQAPYGRGPKPPPAVG